jgi:hypothetical protein
MKKQSVMFLSSPTNLTFLNYQIQSRLLLFCHRVLSLTELKLTEFHFCCQIQLTSVVYEVCIEKKKQELNLAEFHFCCQFQLISVVYNRKCVILWSLYWKKTGTHFVLLLPMLKFSQYKVWRPAEFGYCSQIQLFSVFGIREILALKATTK